MCSSKISKGFQVLGKRKVSICENETNLTKKAKFDTSNGNLAFVTPSHFRLFLSLPLHYGPILSGNTPQHFFDKDARPTTNSNYPKK